MSLALKCRSAVDFSSYMMKALNMMVGLSPHFIVYFSVCFISGYRIQTLRNPLPKRESGVATQLPFSWIRCSVWRFYAQVMRHECILPLSQKLAGSERVRLVSSWLIPRRKAGHCLMSLAMSMTQIQNSYYGIFKSSSKIHSCCELLPMSNHAWDQKWQKKKKKVFLWWWIFFMGISELSSSSNQKVKPTFDK